jgi:GNAT superfamily N-acetyltransferase
MTVFHYTSDSGQTIKVDQYEFKVISATVGGDVGDIAVSVFQTWEEFSHCWLFNRHELRFEQIPDTAAAPVMLLDKIGIDKKYQNQGFGKKALREVLREFRTKGCHTAFLHVATQGEELHTGLRRRLKFYGDTGWIVLAKPASTLDDFMERNNLPMPPLMWHPMSADLSPGQEGEITLEEVIEDRLFRVRPPLSGRDY